mmetsp:Transcript_18948/g.48095  ORF Transcript_18948/g.48095 Transcript_18948/m.48095 type:complete len:110 (+) Transcript_18948:990-1319(+)
MPSLLTQLPPPAMGAAVQAVHGTRAGSRHQLVGAALHLRHLLHQPGAPQPRRVVAEQVAAAACGASGAANGGPLLRCGGCKSAHYCSAACHKAGWKQHKLVCGTSSSKR